MLTYARVIHRGRCYIYRIVAPFRATLSLWRTDSGWVPDDLLGTANHPVDANQKEALFALLMASPRPVAEPEDVPSAADCVPF